MSRSPSPYHHGHLASALEDAALGLLRTRGHAGLSLREVARAAGVSHNAPYNHFEDKAALLARLAERCMAELVTTLDGAQSHIHTGTPQEKAVALAAAYVNYAAEYPERFRLIYDPAVCEPGSPSAVMAPLIGRIEALLARTVSALLPPGEQSGLQHLTTGLWSVAHGLAELVIAGYVPASDIQPVLSALLRVDGTPHQQPSALG